jgi:four helix bundle protein
LRIDWKISDWRPVGDWKIFTFVIGDRGFLERFAIPRRGIRRALPIAMTPEELRDRTKKFALDILRLCHPLTAEPVRSIAVQLSRASTGVGANYRAVCRARSHADFIAKLGIAIEEVDESVYWLEVLSESGLVADSVVSPLRKEAEEITRILVASRRTARLNARSMNRQTIDHQ